MKLSSQIILIVIVMLILQLLGVTYVNIINARVSAQEQLEASAQNTADSLGISLREYMVQDNKPMLATTTRAVFDHGSYQRIAIVKNSGEMIAEFSIKEEKVADVPQWFIRVLALQSPTAKANLMKGWQILGKVEVQASADYIYLSVWRSITREFYWLVGVSAVFSLFLFLLLQYILRPVYRTRDQAVAITLGEFPIQTKIPWTYDFRTVVTAMNTMVRRLKLVFHRHAALSQRLRKQAYQDPLTGFSNMRYYSVRMNFLLSMRDEFIYGALCHIDFKTDEKTKRYQSIKYLSEIINIELDLTFGGFAARLDDDTIVIMMPFISLASAEAQLKKWLQAHKLDYGNQVQCNGAVLGFSGYWQDECLADLIAQLEQRMSLSRQQGNHHIVASMYEKHYDDIDVETLLIDAINNESILLSSSPVIDPHDEAHVLHHCTYLNIDTPSVRIHTARGFSAVAVKLGIAIALDKLVIKKLLSAAQEDAFIHRSYTISKISIQDDGFLTWLNSVLQQHPSACQSLRLETNEYCAIHLPEHTRRLAQLCQQHKVSFGLMRVGREFETFDHFRELPLDYIKINGTYIYNIHKMPENEAFVRELIYVCHSLDIRVMAGAVSSDAEKYCLRNLDIDGLVVRSVTTAKDR